MLHLALKAFAPAPPPFPFLHIATGWDFRAMLDHRDAVTARHGLDLIVHHNAAAAAAGVDPFATPTPDYTRAMLTEALKAALDAGGYDAAFGGGRRDEERARAKERIFSFRSAAHVWDPKLQRPELWRLYNGRVRRGESVRVFPLSNWTELDIWHYIAAEDDPARPALFRRRAPDGGPRRPDPDGRRRPHGVARRRGGGAADHPLPHARRLAAVGGGRKHRRRRSTRSSPRWRSPTSPNAPAGWSITTSRVRWSGRRRRAISDGQSLRHFVPCHFEP